MMETANQPREPLLRLIWRLIYPLLFYVAVNLAVTIVFGIFLQARMMVTDPGAGVEALNREMMKYGVEMTVVSAVISSPFLVMFMRRDRQRLAAAGRGHEYESVSPLLFALPLVMGPAACIVGNLLISLSGIAEASQGFQELAETMYTGRLALELIGLGIIVPVAEELIFRGLIYRRAREFTAPALAAVSSAVIFGVSHGNVAQFFYAAALGLLLAYVYERYHSLAAPILVHAGANLLSIAISEMGGEAEEAGTSILPLVLLGLAGAAVLLGCIWVIEHRVFSREILPETAEGADHEQRAD